MDLTFVTNLAASSQGECQILDSTWTAIREARHFLSFFLSLRLCFLSFLSFLSLFFRFPSPLPSWPSPSSNSTSSWSCSAKASCVVASRSALVVFVGVEQEMQPRQHLIDRGQLTGRTYLAAWPLFTLNAGLALQSRFATLALRTWLSLLAFRTRLAARAFRPGSPRMSLWSRRSLTANQAVRHWRFPS